MSKDYPKLTPEQMEACKDSIDPSRVVARLQAALLESQARVEEYRREVERRDELLAGADADLRESQAREAVLTKALALEAVDVALARTWCRICRTENRSNERSRAAHPHEASCPLASPSDAAAKLLERVEKAELAAKHLGNAADMTAEDLDDVEADRDRWLGRVKSFLAVLGGRELNLTALREVENAARRDLEQHDAGRKP